MPQRPCTSSRCRGEMQQLTIDLLDGLTFWQCTSGTCGQIHIELPALTCAQPGCGAALHAANWYITPAGQHIDSGCARTRYPHDSCRQLDRAELARLAALHQAGQPLLLTGGHH
jgi:hypothetical protein